MKRYSLFTLALLLLLVLVLITGCGNTASQETSAALTTDPQITAVLSSSDTPQDITKPIGTDSSPAVTTQADTPTTSAPATPNLSVPFSVYKQDCESGEYLLQEEGNITLKKASAYTLSPEIPDYYEIDSEISKLSTISATEGDSFVVYFKCLTYTVQFVGGENSTLSQGEATQTLRCGQTPTPPTFSRVGYTLSGFNLPLAPLYEDTTLTAVWTLTEYTLTLYASEGSTLQDESFTEREDVLGCFEKTFTILDSFQLPTPKKEGCSFLSWNTSADTNSTVYTELAKDTCQNLTLYAIYDVKLYEIRFVEENGISFPSYYLPYGTSISSPQIAPESQKAGYGLTWYEEESTTPYLFSTMPSRNITLYGKWEEDTGTGFLSWNIDAIETETIDSKEELLALIDYVHFFNLTNSVTLEVTYADRTAVLADIAASGTLGDFRANGAIGYGVAEKQSYQHENAKCYLEIRVAKSYRDTEASRTSEHTNETTYTYLKESILPRGDAYTDFYIDSLPNSFAVSTTNQLHYVVEHGYRPIVQEGSAAERVYLAAKQVLNAILPENATDLEKVEAIYDYLVLNIQYDDRAVQIAETPGSIWAEYDAFFLEGVFDNKKAVCDGIAKAFTLLCAIEGIPCVEVVGDSHAWNRVKVNNVWYVIDATHGNLHLANSDKSIMDHAHFLMSDAEKASLGYDSISYPKIAANHSYNYYKQKSFTYEGKTYDFVIESSSELTALLAYLLTVEDNLDGCSIDIDYQVRFTSLSSAFQSAVRSLKRSGISFSYDASIVDPVFGKSYKLIFNKK